MTGVPVRRLPNMIFAQTCCRVAFVGNSLDEMLTEEAMERAYNYLLESVTRRQLVPRGGSWVLCYVMPDAPDWHTYLADDIAARMRKDMDTMPEAHVMVWAIADLATIESAN